MGEGGSWAVAGISSLESKWHTYPLKISAHGAAAAVAA